LGLGKEGKTGGKVVGQSVLGASKSKTSSKGVAQVSRAFKNFGRL